MSFSGSSVNSGGRTAERAFEFGRTYVVRPKAKHQATIVWLHGLGDTGGSWSQVLETLPLPNIKWICPTAPSRPISLFGGFPSTACNVPALVVYLPVQHLLVCIKEFHPFKTDSHFIGWFNVADLSEEGPADIEGMDASAAHVANLLSNEPSGIKLAVGGFSMGAAISLYSATCFVAGKYGNGTPFPPNLSAVVGLSGWLPCASSLSEKLAAEEASNRASSLPILLCHGTADDVVQYMFGQKSSQELSSKGFADLTFKSYNGLGHYTNPEEINDVSTWLTSKLNLDGQ